MIGTTSERLNEQRDELLSLQSIYGDDVLSFKTQNCWKQECPLEVTIRIKPQSTNVYVSFDMAIVCGDEYPDKIPQISLINLVELSVKDADELKKLLLDKAKACVGMAMIFDLCQLAESFLSKRNRKPAFSEHEIMLNKVAQKEIEQQRRRVDSENRELAEIAAENERRRAEKLDRENDEGGVERKARFQMLNLGECELVEILSPHYGNGTGEKRRIYMLSELKSHRPIVHKFATEWMAFDQVNQILVTEWTFEFTLGRKHQRKLSANIDFASFERKLELFARLANQKLSTLHVEDQQFFSSYSFVNFKRCATSSPTNFNCKLLIGQRTEPDDRCLASPQVFESIKQDSQKYAPQLAAQIVCALKWLHGQGMSHGYLKAYSVWMLSQQIFRLPKLFELCEEFEKLTSGAVSVSPEELTLAKLQSRDLFALGELLDTILCLEKTTFHLKDSEDAADFVALCQSSDDIEQLIDHKYLVHDLTRPSSDVSLDSTKLPKKLDILPNSRLTKDFQVYQYLGKGGFGDVFLARNKLDDNDYAIKRIPLNPRSNRLNQKIKREAKLFSKLNHEHVVRFYAAWLESIPITTDDTITTSSTTDASSSQRPSSESTKLFSQTKQRPVHLETVLEKSDETEDTQAEDESSTSTSDSGGGKFYRRPKIDTGNRELVEFSTSRQPVSQNVETLFSLHTFQSKSTAEHSEFDVVFYDDDEEEDDVNFFRKNSPEDKGDTNVPNESPKLSTLKTQQILYIQMEYCKNSTLRALIDSGRLYSDPSTVWRIFREILSGLQYIHHQNMIHRDIKPMNIFLDNNCSVKIGDFGLATRDLFGHSVNNYPALLDGGELLKAEKQILDSDLGFTKDVGTAMYIAPEIEDRSAASKFYTSKIDVYSVGIVMFEMVQRPPTTASERFVILQKLRNNVLFPEDFASEMTTNQRALAKKLIVWMLKRDPNERPTVDEILQSEIVPFVSYEDDNFQKTVLQILRKRNTRQFKKIIFTLLNEQEISPVLDYCFDQTICINEFVSYKRNLIMDRIKRELEHIFHLHAFTPMTTHLFSSKRAEASVDRSSQKQCLLLDCSGLPVNLPRNLRQNFIRYCVRNGVSQLKRYDFGKVFEQADFTGGVHPIERVECCVDLVGQALLRNFIAAECIALSIELVRKVSVFDGLKWTLGVGHTKLIKAACIQQNISDQLTQDKVLDVFYNFSTKKKKMNIERKSEYLANCCGITNQLAISLLRMLGTADDFASFSENLRPLTRSKWEVVRQMSRDALEEISKTIAMIRYFCSGIKSENFYFNAGLCYRPLIFKDSLTYFLHVDVFHQGSVRPVTVLAGGSYELAIVAERRTNDLEPSWPICAYGFNMSMEDLVQLYCLRNLEKLDISSCSVLISSNSEELVKTKYELTQKFWELGVNADVIHDSLNSVYQTLEYCEKNSIHILVMLVKLDEVVIYVDEKIGHNLPAAANLITMQQYAKRTSSLLGYRIVQNKIGYEDAIRFVLQVVTDHIYAHPLFYAGSTQSANILSGASGRIFNSPFGTSSLTSLGDILATSSDVMATNVSVASTTTASLANLNINFAMEEKPSHNMRKKVEIQIRNVLGSELLVRLGAKTRVEVFVTEMPPELVRPLSAHIDRIYETVTQFIKAIDVFQQAHKVAGRNKSMLKALVDALQPFLCCGSLSSSTGEYSTFSRSTSGADPVGISALGENSASIANAAVLVLWCKQTTATPSIFYKVVI